MRKVNAKKDSVFIKPVALSFDDPKEIIERIRAQFSKENCRNLILDLTEQSFLNSIRIGVLVATYHFCEFINGKIHIVVQDIQAKKYLDTLNFNGAVVVYANTQEQKKKVTLL